MFQRILSFLSKQKLEKFNFIKSVDNIWSRLFWIHFLENIVKQHVDYSKRYRFELLFYFYLSKGKDADSLIFLSIRRLFGHR